MQSRLLTIIAVGLGLISSFLVYSYLTGLEPMQQVEMAEIVVASRRIGKNSVVTRDMLERRSVPAETVHGDTIRQISDAYGRIATADIMAGEPILDSRLLPAGQVPGMSFTIPPDKRAVTVAVNEVIGVAGFVKPGDRVDVLASFTEETPLTVTILEDIPVLAISQDMEAQPNADAKVGTSVTLAVSPQQAEKLTLAEVEGRLRLSLRPPQATSIASRQGTTADSLYPLALTRPNSLATSLEVQEKPVNQPTPAQPVSVRRVEARPPDTAEWSVEVIKGTSREVKLVHE